MQTDHVQAWLDDLERRRFSPHTLRSYHGTLTLFVEQVGDPLAATPEQVRNFLARYPGRSTQAQRHAALTSFFRRWEREGNANPMPQVERIRRLPVDQVATRTVTQDEVARLLDHCHTLNELVCVALLAYTGSRRAAIAELRWADIDFVRNMIRFHEKGDLIVEKPIAHRLREILLAARSARSTASDEQTPSPPTPPGRVLDPEGSEPYRIVRTLLERVAYRAGVQQVHPHALRRGFAVRYLETHPDQLVALQALMGHARSNTTEVYLHAFNRQRAMQGVLDLAY